MSWSLPSLLRQQGSTIEIIMSRINRDGKNVESIHKNDTRSNLFVEHISETASSTSFSSDMDTNHNHHEYDSLLITQKPPQQGEEKEERIIDGHAVVPSWNTIKSSLINKLQTTCTTNCFIGITANQEEEGDDDEYDSDSDAIHVLYYNEHSIQQDDMKNKSPTNHHPQPSKVLNQNSTFSNHNHNYTEITPVNIDTTPNGIDESMMESMIDQLEIYTTLYSTHHIYDIRIYESILILVLYSNFNHHYQQINNRPNPNQCCDDTAAYEEALQMMATFLVDPSISFSSKLDVLRFLLVQQCCRDQTQGDDESSTGNSSSNISSIFPNATEDEKIILIPDDIVRDMYAFCISLYFGVNDIETTIHRCGATNFYMDDGYYVDDEHFGTSSIMAANEHAITTSIDMTSTISTSNSQRLLCPMIWELRSKCLYLQEMYTIYDDLSMIRRSRAAAIRTSTSLPRHSHNSDDNDPYWEYIKHYCLDHDSLLLQDIDLLKSLYMIIGRGRHHKSPKHQSLQYIMLLASVGHLRICMYHPESVTFQNYYKYSEALYNVALFLSRRQQRRQGVSHQWKMALLYCLQYNHTNHHTTAASTVTTTAAVVESFDSFPSKLQSKKGQSDLNDDYYYSKVVSFCTNADAYTDSFLVTPTRPHSSTMMTSISDDRDVMNIHQNISSSSSSLCAFYLLLWELRVLTCHLQQEQQQQRQWQQHQWILLVRQRFGQFRSFLSHRISHIRTKRRTLTTKPNHILHE